MNEENNFIKANWNDLVITMDGICTKCGSYQFDMVWGCYDCREWPEKREKEHQEKIGRAPKSYK